VAERQWQGQLQNGTGRTAVAAQLVPVLLVVVLLLLQVSRYCSCWLQVVHLPWLSLLLPQAALLLDSGVAVGGAATRCACPG
jgi:hypothetical protein